jgi:hypothetical protein
MNTISQKMLDFFVRKDVQAAADLIGQAETTTQQDKAMFAADKAGFGVEFSPHGIKVWIPN